MPIEFYNQMQMAFGSTMATGRFAMGSGEALGVFSGFGDREGGTTSSTPKDNAGAGHKKPEPAEVSKATEGTGAGGKRKRSCLPDEEAVLMNNMIDAVNNVDEAR